MDGRLVLQAFVFCFLVLDPSHDLVQVPDVCVALGVHTGCIGSLWKGAHGPGLLEAEDVAEVERTPRENEGRDRKKAAFMFACSAYFTTCLFCFVGRPTREKEVREKEKKIQKKKQKSKKREGWKRGKTKTSQG